MLGMGTVIITIRANDLATKQLTGIAGAFARVGSGLAQTGMAMTAVVTAPIIGLLGSMAKVGFEFDKSMKNVQAIGRLSAIEISRASEAILKMSMDITKTTESPKALSEAFYELFSGTQDVNSALQLLEVVSKGASATLTDSTTVANLMIKSLKAYNAEVSMAPTYMDAMVRAIDLGIMHGEDLVSGMGNWINSAASVGVSMQEALGSMAFLTLKGLDPAEASTSLNRFLVSFFKPNPEAVAAAENLGLELGSDMMKKFGMVGSLKIIQQQLGIFDFVNKATRDARSKELKETINATKTELNLATAKGIGTAAIKNRLTALQAEADEIKATYFENLGYAKSIEEMADAARRATGKAVSAESIAALASLPSPAAQSIKIWFVIFFSLFITSGSLLYFIFSVSFKERDAGIILVPDSCS